MSRDLTRREMLIALGAGAVGTALRIAPASHVEPFALNDVRLLDGPFRDAQRRDLRYLLSLDVDRMLANFRTNAGLAPKAPVYGGWESEEPWVGIRCHGHTAGHWLGAAAMMYASTGDARIKERLDYAVRELAACQAAGSTGLVTAFPDGAKPLDDVIAGRRFAGVPWYTMHKVLAGLRDARVHANSAPAGDAFVRLAAWTAGATRDMSDAQLQRMLDTEHGGMNEVLADASVMAREPAYLTLAQRFTHRALLDPMAESRDTLDGLHANTQIPKVVGFQRLYELTGDARYRDAARFFWRTVTERRSFATGGHGDNEHFFPIADFAKHLGSAKTMETCCTHNMLRLTRALFVDEPSSTYADYYERALYNGILASQDDASGMNTYFQATRPGYVRLYHTPDESFWCCTGTGMENHAKYGDSIYFKRGDALYVNLFVPSTVAWRARGLTLTQTTRFPDESHTRLTIAAQKPTSATIRVRRPAWCDAMRVSVNGRRVSAEPAADGYVPIVREWRHGDVIDVELPMTLRAEPLPGVPNVIAFAYGPIVLAAALGTEGLTHGAQIIKNERESRNMLNAQIDVPTLASRTAKQTSQSLTFAAVDANGRDVKLAPYFRMTHERYALYVQVAS